MKAAVCGCGVTRAGGYYAGACKRPPGHDGKHRLCATASDRAARQTPAEAACSGAHVVLPCYSFLAAQPDPPGTARVLVRVELRNEHGAEITYTVQGSRKGGTWWLSASRQGMRMSNTLRTTSATKAALWLAAVPAGRVSIARDIEGGNGA